jgi:hypothetical protein
MSRRVHHLWEVGFFNWRATAIRLPIVKYVDVVISHKPAVSMKSSAFCSCRAWPATFSEHPRNEVNPNGIPRESYNSVESRSRIKRQRPEARRVLQLETIGLIIVVILILAITITRLWQHINWSAS